MGRASSVKTHPAREEIERGIVEGVPIATLARKYTLSESSLQRHKSIAMSDVLAKVPSDEPDIPDVLARLLELANSTRQARVVADRIGTPASRAKAQSNELSVLNMLSSRLGVTNLEDLDWAKRPVPHARRLASRFQDARALPSPPRKWLRFRSSRPRAAASRKSSNWPG